jgi:hypothetical protein
LEYQKINMALYTPLLLSPLGPAMKRLRALSSLGSPMTGLPGDRATADNPGLSSVRATQGPPHALRGGNPSQTNGSGIPARASLLLTFPLPRSGPSALAVSRPPLRVDGTNSSVYFMAGRPQITDTHSARAPAHRARHHESCARSLPRRVSSRVPHLQAPPPVSRTYVIGRGGRKADERTVDMDVN